MLLQPLGMWAPSLAAALLLDGLTVQVAYGLFKMRSAYAGPCLRVRRDSDNAEQDIGFAAGGSLDAASAMAFCGSGSGYVSKWYDQGGASAHAAQATASNQPRIVSSGALALVLPGGKPGLLFSGGQAVRSTVTPSGNLSFLATASRTTTAAVETVLDTAGYNGGAGLTLNLGNSYGPAADASKPRAYGDYGNNTAVAWLNGAKQTGTNPFSTATANTEAAACGVTLVGVSAGYPLTLGTCTDLSNPLTGGIRTAIVLPGILSDAAMAALTNALKSELTA